MNFDSLIYEKKKHVALIVLNRPDKLNALSLGLMEQLRQALKLVDEDDDIRAVVLTGAGERAFTSGFDLEDVVADSTVSWEKLIRQNYDTFMQIWRLNKPVIAAVNGYAVAAGVSLAMICDIVIAADNAVFAEPEIRHFSLSPLLILPWLGNNPKIINYHYFTGDPIPAALAKELGLVAKVVPSAALQEEAWKMAQRIAKVPPFPVQLTKQSLRRTYEIMGMVNALDSHRMIDTIALTTYGLKEKEELIGIMQTQGLKAFLQARDGKFKEN